jgi:hypothetical protein
MKKFKFMLRDEEEDIPGAFAMILIALLTRRQYFGPVSAVTATAHNSELSRLCT